MIRPQFHPEKIWTCYARIWRESAGDLLHFHVMGPLDKVALGLLGALGRRIVLTVHGQSLEDQLDRLGGIARWAAVTGLRRIAALVAVNDRIRQVAIERAGLSPSRVHLVPAFLPPDRAALLAASPGADVTDFLADHAPVLSANAFHLRDYGGVPLYGADLLPAMLARVRERHPRAGALLYVSTCDAGDAGRLEAIRASARAQGVEAHLRIVSGSRPFGPALVRSQVMVRPTVSDGDAVSVREALWLGVPVVASDCVARPDGTRVVKGRDADAFAVAVLGALEAAGAGSPPCGAGRDPFEDLLAVYREVIAG